MKCMQTKLTGDWDWIGEGEGLNAVRERSDYWRQ